MRKLILLVLLLFTYSTYSYATVWTVTSTSNSGFGSLRSKITLANNGDTIRFSPSLIAIGSPNIVLASPLIFSKSLSIIGLYSSSDTLYLSGGGATTLFRISNTSNVVIDSLVMVNGYSTNGGGGAIEFRSSDTLFVRNSVIRNNVATIGGAIYAHAGGGSANSKSIAVEVFNSEIVNNSATNGKGGGIYCKGTCCGSSDSTDITTYVFIDSSLISGNSASMEGGGVYCNAPNTSYSLPSAFASVIVKNSEVRWNSSASGGGIFCIAKSTNLKARSFVSFLNSNIFKNTSLYEGGGVYCSSFANGDTSNMEVQIVNSIIDSNEAGTMGGGIICFANNNPGFNSVKIRVLNSQINGNESIANGGGGICSSGNKSEIYIDSSTISENSAGGSGGGVFVSAIDSEIDVESSYIKYNTSSGNGEGGGIASHSTVSSWVNLNNSTIMGNSSKLGGGIYSGTSHSVSSGEFSIVNVLNSIIDSNYAITNGGGIYSRCPNSNNPIKSEVNVERSMVKNNMALGDGGGIYVISLSYQDGDTSRVSILNSNVTSNTALNGSGGGVYVTSSSYNQIGLSELKVRSSTINRNISGDKGGGFYVGIPLAYSGWFGPYYDSKVQIEILKSTINENSTGIGGGIYTKSSGSLQSYMDVVNSTFAFNNAHSFGGNIYSHNPEINPSSSIFVSSDSINIFRNNIPRLVSGGNNIFSDTALIDTVNSDQIGVDSITLNLDTLKNNGGSTMTLMPLYPSPVLNMGNPLDNSSAQNRTLKQIREVGSCESCVNLQEDIKYACASYTWINGQTYSSSNYIDTATFTNTEGCDSIIELKLTIGYYPIVETISSCNSVTWRNGVTYYSSNNTATDTLINLNGCDTIVLLELTIFDSNIYVDNIVVCDSLTWVNGITYYSSINTVVDTLISNGGCDSVVALNLVVNYTSYGTDSIVGCDSYTWIDGITYNASNTLAKDTLINSLGCDSIVALNLTILPFTLFVDSIVTCDSLTWINGITYYSSTTNINDTLVNAVGCDSIVWLNLTILNASNGVDVLTACDSYTWINGFTYNTSNNVAIHTIPNSVGCDSIVTLDLTIVHSNSRVDVITACDSLTWINGITYYSSNNTLVDTHINSVGCDSIIHLNLTINNVDTSMVKQDLKLTAQATNASFQWIDCNTNNSIPNETNALFVVTLSGDYAVEVSQNGCVDTSECFSFINVGIMENIVGDVTIYPNPTSFELTIVSNNFVIYEIQIFDFSGKRVKTVTSNFDKVNVESLASGIYHLDLIGKKGVLKKTFIKK